MAEASEFVLFTQIYHKPKQKIVTIEKMISSIAVFHLFNHSIWNRFEGTCLRYFTLAMRKRH